MKRRKHKFKMSPAHKAALMAGHKRWATSLQQSQRGEAQHGPVGQGQLKELRGPLSMEEWKELELYRDFFAVLKALSHGRD